MKTELTIEKGEEKVNPPPPPSPLKKHTNKTKKLYF